MSEAYWQAKIWAILHNPALKALRRDRSEGGSQSFWQQLEAMPTPTADRWNPAEPGGNQLLELIQLADRIASASDRGAISSIAAHLNYSSDELEVSHLLSGEKLHLPVDRHQDLLQQQPETQLLQAIPPTAAGDLKRWFWWLWRCLPEATCQLFQDDSLLLIPAETSFPDSSIWSHASLTAAIAGALAGYTLAPDDIEQRSPADKPGSHPYLASFTFTPVQELIKASRKMRDFWAGSWILHYISARVSWKLAQQYGPDTLLYPSLFQQPLIDLWLRQQYPEFSNWIEPPSSRSLLTAGFPNVLVLILPKERVEAAMQTAKQTVKETWRDLGQKVFAELHKQRRWMPDLTLESNTWTGWLNAQWQTYWTAIPIGKEGEELENSLGDRSNEFTPWVDAQNQAYITRKPDNLFRSAETNFLREGDRQNPKFSVNVGSWWPQIFDQTRLTLTAVKNGRNWRIPTAFGPRSTLSGLGPVVHPGKDWITEGETQHYWQAQAGLFDGREQLNATETIKRGLEKILPELLTTQSSEEIAAAYPDLTAGVAGYLKVNAGDRELHFHQACQAILKECPWAERTIQEMSGKWGIPWIDESDRPQQYHSRLLNAGWLVEDADSAELQELERDLNREKDPAIIKDIEREIRQIKIDYCRHIQQIIDRYYPGNNPANWYVLAAGDGDGMSEWLKGKKLNQYRDYIATNLRPESTTFKDFLQLPKRMGPSTHNALSRALLDFSNQLVPYLTEKRYAGRLIYGGGDDVLAYLNLWEWDKWLWDIRQCFRGADDPEFHSQGHYWQWQGKLNEDPPKSPFLRGTCPSLPNRPLFTMGDKATISFGIVIAHQSVPLAIALESLWAAEKDGAKQHKSPSGDRKDAVQVRVIYGNGNILQATAKFDVFNRWKEMITAIANVESALFEQVAQLWNQHPAPMPEALPAWTRVFCDRRDFFQGNDTAKEIFQSHLTAFLESLWQTTLAPDLDSEIQNWLKLAAFVIRQRQILL